MFPFLQNEGSENYQSPTPQILMPVTRNLLAFVGLIFSVSMSPLHWIMVPLKLMAVRKVTVTLMKDPLLKITSDTIGEDSIVLFIISPTGSLLRKLNGNDDPALVLISPLRNPLPVHQNTALSLEQNAPLLLI